MVQRCCFALLLLSTLLSGAGCTSPASLQVTVVAADTQFPVSGATVTLSKGQMALPAQTTDDNGVTSFRPAPPGQDDVMVAAAGYADSKVTVQVQPSTPNMVQVSLTRSAPALVFHTFSGSTANPTAQAATVTVNSPDGTQVFSGDTINVGQSGYDAVTVPNLKPSTTYSYTVSAQGFATVTGSATTHSDATVSEVDVLLLPPSTMNVEVQTSVVSPNRVTFGSAAVVTITAPDGTVTTVTTNNPPVGPADASYDLASPPTVPLTPNTTYQYSALFTQYVGAPGNPVTKSFTTPMSSAGSDPFVVSIMYDPSASRTSSAPSKALP